MCNTFVHSLKRKSFEREKEKKGRKRKLKVES